MDWSKTLLIRKLLIGKHFLFPDPIMNSATLYFHIVFGRLCRLYQHSKKFNAYTSPHGSCTSKMSSFPVVICWVMGKYSNL